MPLSLFRLRRKLRRERCRKLFQFPGRHVSRTDSSNQASVARNTLRWAKPNPIPSVFSPLPAVERGEAGRGALISANPPCYPRQSAFISGLHSSLVTCKRLRVPFIYSFVSSANSCSNPIREIGDIRG